MAVKWFMRGLTVLLLCVGTLSVLGCGPDNETEADRLAKTIGDPGKPDPKGVPAAADLPPAKTQEEVFKRQQERQKDLFKGGYPAKK
jgi:hypothetical protein